MTAQKLVLIKPEVAFPVKKQGYAGDVGIPLGLLYLANYVRAYNGVDVSIADHRLNRVLGKPIITAEDVRNADIVGVGACTSESPGMLSILRQAKTLGKTTIAGGLYPTFNAEEVLRTGFVDYVVHGEGEAGLSKLIKALNGEMKLEEIKGISFVKDGRIVRNLEKDLIKDLNSIPLPAYDLVPMEEYAKFSPASIYAARGCPMSCEFCTLNELWEYKYRKRSFENVLQELQLFKEAGFKRVHFKDETITLNRKWCAELFKEIESANLGMSYKVKSRINGLDEPLLQQMMRAGVDTIHSGIESISQRTLNGMSKQVNVKSILDSFELMLSNGCQVNPVYMFSWMGEKPEDLEANSLFIQEMGQRKGVITYVSFITPHPGSNLVNKLGKDLRILSTDYARYTHKQPVAVPYSLGDDGIRLMVDHYHRIGEVCDMQDVNPRIDPVYLEEISPSNETWKDREVLGELAYS